MSDYDRVIPIAAPPMLGDRVIYTRAEGEEYAAIIVQVASATAAMLVVFMPSTPTGRQAMVASKTWYSGRLNLDPHGAQNTWRWRPDGSR